MKWGDEVIAVGARGEVRTVEVTEAWYQRVAKLLATAGSFRVAWRNATNNEERLIVGDGMYAALRDVLAEMDE